jgi:hypothetical protein
MEEARRGAAAMEYLRGSVLARSQVNREQLRNPEALMQAAADLIYRQGAMLDEEARRRRQEEIRALEQVEDKPTSGTAWHKGARPRDTYHSGGPHSGSTAPPAAPLDYTRDPWSTTEPFTEGGQSSESPVFDGIRAVLEGPGYDGFCGTPGAHSGEVARSAPYDTSNTKRAEARAARRAHERREQDRRAHGFLRRTHQELQGLRGPPPPYPVHEPALDHFQFTVPEAPAPRHGAHSSTATAGAATAGAADDAQGPEFGPATARDPGQARDLQRSTASP